MASKIISLSMVKNEQDIIEPFIRHHSKLVDCMFIMDNNSVDDTKNIILKCARELGNIIVTNSSEFSYNQAERMTKMLHHVQRAVSADYVLFLDADEFLSFKDKQSLEAVLSTIPKHGVGHFPWQTSVLHPEDLEDQVADVPKTMLWKRARENDPVFCKVVLRLDGGPADQLAVSQGNHYAMVIQDGRALKSVTFTNPLYHFPVRSTQQITCKGVVGWMAYMGKDPTANAAIVRYGGAGGQWAKIFDNVVTNRPPVGTSLCEASMEYALWYPDIDWNRDAIKTFPFFDYERKYSTGEYAEPTVVIARSWEKQLEKRSQIDFKRPDSLAGDGAGASSFDAKWHWDQLFVDVAPFKYIAERYEPKSVLDIGCGIGAYLDIFKKYGAEVVGVDGIPKSASILKDSEYIVHDLSQPFFYDKLYDVVVCVEVLEHLTEGQSIDILNTIVKHAGNTIVFSAAVPGQNGENHINCQPIGYWLEKFSDLGWIPDVTESLGIRAISSMSWFKHNLVVLHKGEDRSGINKLVADGNKPFRFWTQEAGIRQEAFVEPIGG